MWDRLRRELDLELAELSGLVTTAELLPTADGLIEPSAVECLAAAAILHSFYNGAENLLRRIEIATCGTVPRGDHWHAQLLELASRETAYRPRVLSDSLTSRLTEYLRFRHAFRHLYAQHLGWEGMDDLVANLATASRALESEVRGFLTRLGSWAPPSPPPA